VRDIFRKCDMENIYLEKTVVHTKSFLVTVKDKLMELYQQEWREQVNTMPKLRTYKLIKEQYGAETYLCNHYDRGVISVMSRFRCGTFPLKIETGRWRGLQFHERVCTQCETGAVESELHFLMSKIQYKSYISLW